MEKRKRLAVFHRNRLLRDCLKTYLVGTDQLDVVPVDHGELSSVDELQHLAADVVLLDLNLPDGLSIAISRFLKANSLSTKIILLVPEQHDQLFECIGVGAHGCVLEQSSLQDLSTAITRVLAGEAFCSQEIVSKMLSEIARFNQGTDWQPRPLSKEKRLTPREHEVLELLNERKSNKEIAAQLSVSLFTVKNHVRSILEKFDAENRVEVVDLARQQNQVKSARNLPR
ncbi:LuxR C-terminal-related transcriptional regulator [Stieleria maiorica]|nr:response regulator transcription factor [Stieleria maiorica]